MKSTVTFCKDNSFVYNSLVSVVQFALLVVLSTSALTNSNDVEPPHTIQMQDSNEKVYNELRLTANVTMETMYFKCDSPLVEWNLTGIPEGLDFFAFAAFLSGTPKKAYSGTLNVTAYNSAGSVSALYNIEIVECGHGFVVNFYAAHLNMVEIELSKGSVSIKNFTSTSVLDSNMCIQPDTYNLRIHCRSADMFNCYVRVSNSKSITYFLHEFVDDKVEDFTMPMIPTSKPTITLPTPEVMITSNTQVHIPIEISGIYSPPIFNPELPEMLSLDLIHKEIAGAVRTQGIYKIAISTSNDIGKSESTLTLYVNTCKPDQTLIHFYHEEATNDQFAVKTNTNVILVQGVFNEHTYHKTICLTPGEYQIDLYTSGNTTQDWHQPLLVFDDKNITDDVIIKNNGRSLQTERLIIGYLIPEGSSYQYLITNQIDKKWTKESFRAKGWSEGQTMKWGHFSKETSTVLFRKQFTLSSEYEASLLDIDLKVADGVIVYLNEKEIMRRNLPYTDITPATLAPYHYSTQSWLRSTIVGYNYVVKGTNQLAIEIHRSQSTFETAVIQFDLRLHLSAASSTRRGIQGQAYSSQKEIDPIFLPEYAFSDDSWRYWRSTELPVTLDYIFDNHEFDMITKLTTKSTAHNAQAFTVYGLVTARDAIGNYTILLEEEIGRVQSHAFLSGLDVDSVQLTPRHAYNGIRIVYTNYTTDEEINVFNNKLYVGDMQVCSHKWGRPETLVNSMITKKCPWRKVGVRYYRCIRVNSEATWYDDQSMCLSRSPSGETAYIDTWLVIKGARMSAFDKFKQVTSEFILKTLTVWAGQISYPVVYDITSNEPGFKVLMRFTVEKEISDYVIKKWKNEASNYTQEAVERINQNNIHVTSITVDGKIKLYSPPNTSIIMTIIIVAIVVIVVQILITSCIWVSLYNRFSTEAPKTKRLLRKATKENSLLSDVA